MNRLYRSRNNSVIAGVCGGMAEYFGIDPVLMRLLWLGLFLCGSIGFFVYIIAWIIIPLSQEQNVASPPKRLLRSRDDRVLAGICGGLGKYFDKDPVLFRIALVVLLFSFGIGLGLYLLGILLIPNESR